MATFPSLGLSRGQRYLAVGGLALILVLVYVFSLPWEPSREEASASPFTALDPSEEFPLAVRSWVPVNRVERGRTIDLQVAMENLSPDRAVHIQLLHVLAPGLAKTGDCWTSDAEVPACHQAGNRASEFELAPGDSTIVHAELETSASVRRAALLVVASASYLPLPPAFTPPKSRILTLEVGPIETVSSLGESTRRSMLRFYDVLKNLAIPLVAGGFLTWLLTTWDSNRRKSAQEEAIRRTEVQEVWTHLLDWYLDIVQKYYLPLEGQIGKLVLTTKESRFGGSHFVEVFYAFMSLQHRMRCLSRGHGGFSFKDRRGEEVARLAWHGFLHHVKRLLPEVPYYTALDEMDADESLAVFQARLDALRADLPPSRRSKRSERHGSTEAANTPMKPSVLWLELEKSFERWLDASPTSPPSSTRDSPNLQDSLPFVEILAMILHHEINRPFKHWYD